MLLFSVVFQLRLAAINLYRRIDSRHGNNGSVSCCNREPACSALVDCRRSLPCKNPEWRQFDRLLHYKLVHRQQTSNCCCRMMSSASLGAKQTTRRWHRTTDNSDTVRQSGSMAARYKSVMSVLLHHNVYSVNDNLVISLPMRSLWVVIYTAALNRHTLKWDGYDFQQHWQWKMILSTETISVFR